MLLKNRIDYTIEYPVNVKRVLERTATDITLESLEIAGSPSYIVGYVACNKGPFGQKVIADINIALQKLYQSYSFYQAHIRYINEIDVSGFNRAYQTIFQVDIPIENEH